MKTRRFDTLVIGAGPAGSVAALTLARGGARVALVDKANFPRDKACGDLIGPRGVRVLEDLAIVPNGERVGDMEVIGPTGHRVLLRSRAGTSYPGFGLAVPRRDLDAGLRRAALEAGAEGFTGRAGAPLLDSGGGLDGFCLEGGEADGTELRADVVIGADGALSRVAAVAALVEERRVLWGFAVRGYARPEEHPRPAASVPLPQILFWEPTRWAGYPGYGWCFPGVEGAANIGLGVGLRGDRRAGARAARDLDAFVAHLRGGASPLEGRLGGWLKMGMVGTTPARGRTLLVGDAAGLVNSLQGEGISQALGSGRAAAQAVLGEGPSGAGRRYSATLAELYAPYAASTAPITAGFLARPRLIAALGRFLTAPGVGRLVAGGWSVYWNDLLDGAPPGAPSRSASCADLLARISTRWGADHRSVWTSLGCEPAGQPISP
jgi:geranylgeranyl reductase family protein